MLIEEELQAIKGRLAKTGGQWTRASAREVVAYGIMHVCLVSNVKADDWGEFIAHAPDDIATLIAEVERLREIVAANPVRRESVQKRLRAQVLDATSEGKGKITFPRKSYDLAGPENRHIAHLEGHSSG